MGEFRNKLRVHRERYYVKGHESHNKDGKVEHVEGHWVPETSYEIEDRGKEGRTPEENRWYHANGTLYGWSTREDAEERHRDLEKAAREEGWGRVFHKLIGLHNVTTSEKTKQDAEDDVEWIERHHGRELHESLKRQKPNPVTGGMSESEIKHHREEMRERRYREIEDSLGVSRKDLEET